MSPVIKSVTTSEANLLHLARGLLDIEPWERIETLLLLEQNAPRRILEQNAPRAPAEQNAPGAPTQQNASPGLRPAAMALLQQTLAQGTAQVLVRAGGWRRERFLRDTGESFGRLWERTPPADLAIHFSPHSLHFLFWLLETNLSKGRAAPLPAEIPSAPAIGDRFLAVCAFRVLRDSPAIAALVRHPLLANDGFLQLAFIDEWLIQQRTNSAAGDFEPWMQSPGSAILEAWTPRLVACWDQLETSKQSIVDADELLAVSQSQQHVLTAFLRACEAHARRDLAQFLFSVLQHQLRRPPEQWFAGVAYHHLRLEDRRTLWATALGLIAALDTLAAWNEQARRARYVDDDYDAAQFWKSLWETHAGDRLVEQARAVRQHFAL